MVLSKKSVTSAHIRIFLAFRIYINFYSNLKIEPATPDLHLNFLKCTQCKKSCFCSFLSLETLTIFMFGQFWQGKSPLSPFLDYECMVSFWPSYPNLFLNPKYIHSYAYTSPVKMTLSFRWNRGIITHWIVIWNLWCRPSGWNLNHDRLWLIHNFVNQSHTLTSGINDLWEINVLPGHDG